MNKRLLLVQIKIIFYFLFCFIFCDSCVSIQPRYMCHQCQINRYHISCFHSYRLFCRRRSQQESDCRMVILFTATLLQPLTHWLFIVEYFCLSLSQCVHASATFRKGKNSDNPFFPHPRVDKKD